MRERATIQMVDYQQREVKQKAKVVRHRNFRKGHRNFRKGNLVLRQTFDEDKLKLNWEGLSRSSMKDAEALISFNSLEEK